MITESWERERTVVTEDECRQLLREQKPFHSHGDRPPGYADETVFSPDLLRHFANVGYGEFDHRQRLGRVARPTLVIVGEHDRTTTPPAARVLHRIAGSELAVVLHAEHMSFVQRPAEYVEAVGSFLRRTAAAGVTARR